MLRAGYVVSIIGIGMAVSPSIIEPAKSWAPDRRVVAAMLGALYLLALMGLRHPVRMWPLLFWEIAWQEPWLLRIAMPAWIGGRLDAVAAATAMDASRQC